MFLHQASGLYLTAFRAYDPYSGRWLTRDPAGEMGDINLYAYAGDDPINEIDPLGLWQATFSGGDLWGGSVSFGYNSGQWNFGTWVGAGAGASERFNPYDSGCGKPGFQGSVKVQENWNLGQYGGGGVGFQATTSGSVTAYGSYSTGGGVSVYGSYNFNTGTFGAGSGLPTWGQGTSAFAGVGGTYTSQSSQCGCGS